MPILLSKEREATTQSRFLNKRERVAPKRPCYLGTNFIRRRDEVLFGELGSHTILHDARGVAPVDGSSFLGVGKE